MKNKKGQAIFDTVSGIFTTVAVVAIAAVVTFLIIAQGQTQVLTVEGINASPHSGSDGSAAYNATVAIQSAASELPAWIPIIIVTLIGVALLGLVAVLKRMR